MGVSRKKFWEVIKASKRPFSGIAGSGRWMEFGRSGAFKTSDAGLAREIDTKWGLEGGTGEVVVVEKEDRPEMGHRYMFTMPEMPWKGTGEPARKESWRERAWRILGPWKGEGGDPDAIGSS